MTTDDKIRDEKLQYDINRKAATISAISSAKIDKYEYLTDKEILPPDQSRVIGKASFTHSSLGKAFEQQIKTVDNQGEKMVEALKFLKLTKQKLTIDDEIPEEQSIEEDKSKKEKRKKKQKGKIQYMKQINMYIISNNMK